MSYYECPTSVDTAICTKVRWWDGLLNLPYRPLADRLYCLMFLHPSDTPYNYKSCLRYLNSCSGYGDIYPNPNDDEIPF